MLWLKDAAERALSTFAQGVLAAIGGDTINAWSLDWQTVLGLGAGAAVLSFLKSVVARHVGDSDSASLAE